MDLKQIVRELSQLSRKLSALSKISADRESGRLKAMRSALAALRALSLDAVRQELEAEESSLQGSVVFALDRRREMLHAAAKEMEVPSKRYSDYDRVGIFTVSYADVRVRVKVGGELVEEFPEVDGRKLFERLQEFRRALESSPFERELFFRQLKSAYTLLNRERPASEGWVSIRELYAYLVLIRNTAERDFIRSPDPRNFRRYSSAQFVFDLARFGAGGWICGAERLQSRTPNMRTVLEGQTMMLPGFEGSDQPPIADLRVGSTEA
jgi:hypothetical protein